MRYKYIILLAAISLSFISILVSFFAILATSSKRTRIIAISYPLLASSSTPALMLAVGRILYRLLLGCSHLPIHSSLEF
jgi:hypothetical protein